MIDYQGDSIMTDYSILHCSFKSGKISIVHASRLATEVYPASSELHTNDSVLRYIK